MMKWYQTLILACGLAFVAPQFSMAQPGQPGAQGQNDPRGGAKTGQPGQPGQQNAAPDKKDDRGPQAGQANAAPNARPNNAGNNAPNAAPNARPNEPANNAPNAAPNARPNEPVQANAAPNARPNEPVQANAAPNARPNEPVQANAAPNARPVVQTGPGVVAGAPAPAPGMKEMDPVEFNNLLNTVSRASFSSNKVARIRAAAKMNYFSADQVRQLMKKVNMENDRITVAVELYSRVVDRQNWNTIYSALTFSSSRVEIDRQLGL